MSIKNNHNHLQTFNRKYLCRAVHRSWTPQDWQQTYLQQVQELHHLERQQPVFWGPFQIDSS